jgi:hypothetical protein
MGSQTRPKQPKAETALSPAASDREVGAVPRSVGSNRALTRLFRLARSGGWPPALTITPPAAEREADRVAAEVMRPVGGAVSVVPASPAAVHRKCPTCEEGQELRRSEAGDGPADRESGLEFRRAPA